MWVLIIPAIVMYAVVLLFIKAFGENVTYKYLGQIVSFEGMNPVLRLFVESLLWMLGGIALLIFGAIGTSPIWLLIIGKPIWAAIAFAVVLLISTQTKVTAKNGSIPTNFPLWLKMLIGLGMLMIGGIVFAILGAILASPVIITVLAIIL